MEDRKLIEMLYARSQKAIEILASRFEKRLFSTAFNILNSREDAMEAVNDTYFAIWNAIPPAQPDPLEGFVYRTGRNVALKKLRFQSAQKRNSQYDISLDELSAALTGSSMDEELDARLLGKAIDRFLCTLPRMSRVLFLRRYWFGGSVTQLSKEFSITENNISVRLSRIRSQLKQFLIEEGFIYEP